MSDLIPNETVHEKMSNSSKPSFGSKQTGISSIDVETTVQRLIRGFVRGQLLLIDQEFAKDLTVADYLALTDAQESALWDHWFNEAAYAVPKTVAID